jgi:pyruvate dehydrogenase E2 component (dihydrolipoamide acetyltransferase)
MAQPFNLPDLGEGIHEGEIVSVLVAAGDSVTEGQPIIVVETDKATVEIPSPFSGTVTKVRVEAEEVVHVGQTLMEFRVEGAEEEPVAAEAAEPALLPEAKAEEPPAVLPAGAQAGPVPASPATRRLARELGVDLRDVSPSGPAGLVTAVDVRSHAEARKSGEAPKPAPETQEKPKPKPPTPPALTPVRPSTVGSPALPDFGHWGPVERLPLRSVRRATAKQMALAWSQIPHVSHQEEADITELERFRLKHKDAVEAAGGHLSLTVFAVKALVAALKSFPRFNASLDPETEEIILKRYYHIGVAVDTERGLVVPVIRDADRKSVQDLAVEIQQMSTRAREAKVDLESLRGGTFTLTNIGPLGGTGFTPIINYPEVAIMGMGRARLQPVVQGSLEDYRVRPRLILPLVLAFDHRVLDGADAARFANKFIACLEDPDKLLMES